MRLLVVLLLISQLLIAREPLTIVKNQAEFECAVAQINDGREMHLVLRKGQYVLRGILTANAPLSISGRKATITAYDNIFKCKSSYSGDGDFWVYEINENVNPYSLFFDEKGTIVSVSESVDGNEGVNFCSGIIFSGDGLKVGAVVKIPIPENLQHMVNKKFDKAFGYFDCGWQVVKFLLLKSDDDFFYCKTLNNCRTGNYSYDKDVYKKAVRFVIYNAEKKIGSIYYDEKFLYVPKNYKCVYQLNCTNYTTTEPGIVVYSDISLKGVRFCGFKGMEVKSMSSSECEITDCKFQNCLGFALKIDRKKDAIVRDAKVKGCDFADCSLMKGYVMALTAPTDGNNYIVVSSCNVTRYSGGWVSYKNPDGGIWVNGNAVLNGNVVYNQPRCHLYFNGGQIIAEGNVLYNTDLFNEQVNRNFSSDWGLIYCNHIFSDTEKALNNTRHHISIKDNLLYGAYAYGGNARGIFIDNGRGDIECIGNIVLNTQLYSIDARNSDLTEASSVRNKYEGNIVTTRYRLVSGNQVKGNDMPSIKGNHMVNSQKNILSNVNVLEEDVSLDAGDSTTRCIGERIYVSRSLYKELKISSAWKRVKKFVKVN